MRISELITKLQNDLENYGDLRVWYKSTQTGVYLDLQYTLPIKGDGRYDKNNPNELKRCKDWNQQSRLGGSYGGICRNEKYIVINKNVLYNPL